MEKRYKKGITLIALVITIVIMLLLAGVAIQMSLGENGIIAKSAQAKKEQAKAELIETVKISYLNLKTKAIENVQPTPGYELSISTTEFLDKYNIVNNNIVDKKGNIIETKEEILKVLKSEYPSSSSVGGSSAILKTVGGVPIREADKDKMILKLRVNSPSGKFKLLIGNIGEYTSQYMNEPIIKADFGNGTVRNLLNQNTGEEIEYNNGEYILKFENITYFTLGRYIYSDKKPGGQSLYEDDYEIDVIQWGKLDPISSREFSYIVLNNVNNIYEPEPDYTRVMYGYAKFNQIPENLFSKKKNSKESISNFYNCKNITTIPENLFKENVNCEDFGMIFQGCSSITQIPENLFKYNTKAISFQNAFAECSGLVSIPDNLFNNCPNARYFGWTFYRCTGLTHISENIVNMINNLYGQVDKTNCFKDCINADNYTTIPRNLVY